MGEDGTGLPAALGLAIVQQFPGHVLDLAPRRPRPVCLRVIQLLQTELLNSWAGGPTPGGPIRVLRYLIALDRVRDALEADTAEQLGAPVPWPSGGDLLAEVAHDLQSPMTAILFLTGTLASGTSGPLNERQRYQLGVVYGAALALNSLTSDALELARDGDRLAPEDAGPISVAELLHVVRDSVRPIAEIKGLEFRVAPPAVDSRIAHSLALRRALLNLATNALKFTHQGYVALEARDLPGDLVEFTVRDTGPGIHVEARAALFQPFRRAADGHRVLFSPTGLGLAVTRRLVEAMGGSLQYDTDPDRGTAFRFAIPLPPAGGAAPAP